jgi:hypothetical protein
MEEVRDAMMRLPRFDCARTGAALEGSGLVCPPIDADFVRTLVAFYLEKGVLTASTASLRQFVT